MDQIEYHIIFALLPQMTLVPFSLLFFLSLKSSHTVAIHSFCILLPVGQHMT